MKSFKIFSLIALSAVISSCVSNYQVSTRMDTHGHIERTLFSPDSTFFLRDYDRHLVQPLPQPMTVDFHSSTDTMHFRLDLSADTLVPLLSDAPVCRPVEHLSRHFRWFTTRYTYQLHFDRWPDIPLPLDRYLTPEQARLYLRGNQYPDDWNGLEIHSLLDTLESLFNQWLAAAYLEILYDGVCQVANPEQLALLQSYHDSLQAQLNDQTNILDLDIVSLAAPFPQLSFLETLKQQHELEISSIISPRIDLLVDLSRQVLYTIDLPGADQQRFVVDGARLLYDDLDIEATSQRVNWWAWLITAIAVALVVGCVIRRKSDH